MRVFTTDEEIYEDARLFVLHPEWVIFESASTDDEDEGTPVYTGVPVRHIQSVEFNDAAEAEAFAKASAGPWVLQHGN